MQTAFVRFFALPRSRAYLELVAPDGPASVLNGALAKGGGVHHICYSTPCLDGTLQHLRSAGAIVIRRPVPAVAFCNRRIAWVMDESRALVELVERESQGDREFVSDAS